MTDETKLSDDGAQITITDGQQLPRESPRGMGDLTAHPPTHRPTTAMRRSAMPISMPMPSYKGGRGRYAGQGDDRRPAVSWRPEGTSRQATKRLP